MMLSSKRHTLKCAVSECGRCHWLFYYFVLHRVCWHMQQPKDGKAGHAVFDVLIFSLIPLSFFRMQTVLRRLSNTRIALIISISGNVMNVILNYCLIWRVLRTSAARLHGFGMGHVFCTPVHGCRFWFWFSKCLFLGHISHYWKLVKINWSKWRNFGASGSTRPCEFTFEIAAFAIAGLMSGSFGKEQIDAHGIALQIAAFTYMFGSGIGSASTIRTAKFLLTEIGPASALHRMHPLNWCCW